MHGLGEVKAPKNRESSEEEQSGICKTEDSERGTPPSRLEVLKEGNEDRSFSA
jgi:hypothetical protein